MSDHTPNTQDTPPEASQDDSIDHSRRKLTGAALGVSAVFTLASRPVWANQCTVSGMASGNLSSPDQVTCAGCTPGYWRECQHLFAWAAAGYSPTHTFNDVFSTDKYKDCAGIDYTLLDVMYLNGGSWTCTHQNPDKNNKPANPDGAPGCATGTAFGDLGGDPIATNLGFHAVAALLNAGHPGVNYGYEPGDIITMFQNAVNSGQGAALKDTLDMLNNREPCPLGSDSGSVVNFTYSSD
ncbi:MAG: hypothetical protein ACYC0G_04565 [Thiobacillus sp.]|jgi:hypothetical protein|nr:hypothetical protein [Gammaproteobacteria bacterium]